MSVVLVVVCAIRFGVIRGAAPNAAKRVLKAAQLPLKAQLSSCQTLLKNRTHARRRRRARRVVFSSESYYIRTESGAPDFFN